ncbi:ABC transporter ATP-binding protein [Desulfonatronum lacustre]|uniref:ABC transporter ATP-binding protein n=1 Tax=Desulfonatronum lacustre TaxID=66849 RepID=UPI000491BD91|nr:ABC transporter ATP-binding protein [Desulfonatronum lacustre]
MNETVFSPPLLLMDDVRKRREQPGSVFELHVPLLQVRPGEMVALIGDSGCGKSTLLDMIALVMQPTRSTRFTLCFGSGVDKWDVQALWKKNDESNLAALRRSYMGYVLQTGGLLSFLKVRDNVLLPARIKGDIDCSKRLPDIAHRLGVHDCLDRMPTSLSIGQRQRVAILRALVHGPPLVLADEPTAAVDKPRAQLIMRDLQALARENQVAVVVVTHDTELIADADRIYTFTLSQVAQGEIHSHCRPRDN